MARHDVSSSRRAPLLLLLHALLLLLLAIGGGRAVKLQGGSALALAGKNCAVLAMDQRVGTRWVGVVVVQIS